MLLAWAASVGQEAYGISLRSQAVVVHPAAQWSGRPGKLKESLWLK